MNESFAGTAKVPQKDPKAQTETTSEKRQYTVKGIEGKTVEMIRLAARKRGMRVNAFVSEQLNDAAARVLEGRERSDPDEVFAAILDHIRTIKEFQCAEKEKIEKIQDELGQVIRAQHSMMSKMMS